MLGGDDGRTLFMLCARTSELDEARAVICIFCPPHLKPFGLFFSRLFCSLRCAQGLRGGMGRERVLTEILPTITQVGLARSSVWPEVVFGPK